MRKILGLLPIVFILFGRTAAYDCSAQAFVVEVQCQALVDLYDSTDGDNRSNNSNRLATGVDIESWHGVSRAGSNVSSLIINDNNLSGTIPDSIGNLSGATTIWLQKQNLHGVIPDGIGNLSSVEDLFLQNNEFTGTIPDSIGNLSSIIDLRLNGNNLVGPIPDSIGNLDTLERLNLLGNNFNSVIPESIGNLNNILELQFFGANFIGPIPDSIGNLTTLIGISFGNNNLSGPIPDSIGNLTNLDTILIWGNNLSGPIPSSIGNLTNLATLGFDQNNISGPIPDSIKNLTKLENFWFHTNNITYIPPSFSQLSGLTLGCGHNNNFVFVPSIYDFTSLEKLQLDYNHLLYFPVINFTGIQSNLGGSLNGSNYAFGNNNYYHYDNCGGSFSDCQSFLSGFDVSFDSEQNTNPPWNTGNDLLVLTSYALTSKGGYYNFWSGGTTSGYAVGTSPKNITLSGGDTVYVSLPLFNTTTGAVTSTAFNYMGVERDAPAINTGETTKDLQINVKAFKEGDDLPWYISN